MFELGCFSPGHGGEAFHEYNTRKVRCMRMKGLLKKLRIVVPLLCSKRARNGHQPLGLRKKSRSLQNHNGGCARQICRALSASFAHDESSEVVTRQCVCREEQQITDTYTKDLSYRTR